MQARSRELSALLVRLNRGLAGGEGEPPNPGFEPDSGPSPRHEPSTDPTNPMPPLPADMDPALEITGAGAIPAAPPLGWQIEGNKPGPEASAAGVTIDRKNPHSGQGSLRLASPTGPASVLSGSFVPNSLSSLTIQAFFRSAPADAVIRVWIEGESGGQPYIRRLRVGRDDELGRAGGPCLGPAAGRARLGPAAIRADDAGRPLDRRPAHPGRFHVEIGPAQRTARPAGGLAGAPGAAVRRLCAPGRIALGPAVGDLGLRPAGPGSRRPVANRSYAGCRGFCPILGPKAQVRSHS